MDIGATLKRARLDAGMDQSELAARAATSQPTLSAYENGRRIPSATTFARILAAAGKGLSVVPARRPTRTPSAAEHERVARDLRQVLDLAAALPARPADVLTYPGLPRGTRR